MSESIPVNQSAAVLASESFWSIVLRRIRYLVAIVISGWLFLLIAWPLIASPPEMGGVSLLAWPSAGGPFAALVVAVLLIVITAVCTFLVHPDTPHMGLACALVGTASLSIRGGTVHMLIQNAKNAHAYAAASQLLALECLEWGVIFLFAEFFARFIHDRFFSNAHWLKRGGREIEADTAKRFAKGQMTVGVSLALSRSLRTHDLPRVVTVPFAMGGSVVVSLLLLYVFMQSPMKDQVLFACVVSFFLSTLAVYMAFPRVPALAFFLAVPVTAAIGYFVWRTSEGVYPGLGGAFISNALPIDFFCMGIPGAILGYYAGLHWSLNTEDQPVIR